MFPTDVMTDEVAKVIAASVAGAGVAGTGKLWQLIKGKFARRSATVPATLEEWQDFLSQLADDDPELYEQLVLALAETNPVVPREEDRPAFVPPIPFCDRDDLRKDLPEYGFYGFAGPRGCGKTALVQQLAVDCDARFPLHRAYVNLDEFRVGDVLRVSEVKRHLLLQLGIEDVVAADAELGRQYLRVPLTRRSLLIIENVLGADEVAALVADWPKVLVLVTTRRLTKDLQVCGPRWIELNGLDSAGARALLASRCPERLTNAEPTAVETLLEWFGRQPHAIHVLAPILSRRAGEPKPVAGLLAELEEMGINETDELLGAILSGHVGQVPEGMREVFGLLALCPAGEFSVTTASVLLGCPVREARKNIEQLRELGLIEAMDNGRYRMSWSIRRFAVDFGVPAGSEAALDRLLAYYVARAVAADYAGGSRMRYYPVLEADPWPRDENRIVWLEVEARVLAELVEYAYARGRDDEVGQICGGLEVLSLHRGWYELCLAAYERGVQAARRQGALPLLARQHALCGRMATLLHRFDRARSELEAARAIAASLSDSALDASISEFLGRLAEEQAGTGPMPDWWPAIEAFSRAVEIDRRLAVPGPARGLHCRMLANVLVKAGQEADARLLLQEAIEHTGDDRNASRVYTVWAKCDVVRGDSAEARANLQRAEERAAAAGADQYRVELADLRAEIEFLEQDFGRARSRWAAIAQAYVEQGHPRAREFFAKLNRIPPGR